MLWIVLLAGLAVLLVTAWLKPSWFANVWETSLKELWVGFVGLALGLVEWLSLDPTWQALVPVDYLPWALIGLAALGWLIRRVNVPKKKR